MYSDRAANLFLRKVSKREKSKLLLIFPASLTPKIKMEILRIPFIFMK